VSRSTFQGAIDELEALLVTSGTTPATALATAGVTAVYDHEPGATGVPSGCTVTLSPGGFDPTMWIIRLRIYITDRNAAADQALLVASSAAVDAAVRAGEGFLPERWEMGWQPDLGVWLAAVDVSVGRQDYF
jgi:hypothetical protein